MINITQTCTDILTKTSEESLKTIGEIYLPSFIFFWLATLILIIIIGVKTLDKDWDKFFLIFIIPFLIMGIIMLLFTFIIPIIPQITGELFKGLLG